MPIGLTVAVAATIPESMHAQMNMSSPSAGGVPKSTSGNMTTEASTKTDTFSANGIISSLVFVTQNPNDTISNGNSAAGIKDAKKFVLAGDWVLTVNNGKVTDFTAKFIKVLDNGQKWHTHVITRFRPVNDTKVSLAPDRSASLSGTVDVKLNGTSVWNTTKVNLMINKGKTLTINLDNQATSNHFQGQPIYGVVESMKDLTGNEMLKAQEQAVQRTEK
ncbi:MAG TPA: hypothetical protein VE971_03410 [Candidatus Eisenbacteria bacterium]|nr:hypothetical protein [Candidatus Eisenbacteria bacterium]